MRPASEIHSSLEMVEHELLRLVPLVAQYERLSIVELASLPEAEAKRLRSAHQGSANLTIVRNVLRWVTGEHWTELTDGENAWLCAFLLDDPPKIDDTDPRTN